MTVISIKSIKLPSPYLEMDQIETVYKRIVVVPVEETIECIDESLPKSKRSYDITLRCLDNNMLYALTLRQTAGLRIMFRLMQDSIQDDFRPVLIQRKKIGDRSGFRYAYGDSRLMKELPVYASIQSMQVACRDACRDLRRKYSGFFVSDLWNSPAFRNDYDAFADLTNSHCTACGGGRIHAILIDEADRKWITEIEAYAHNQSA